MLVRQAANVLDLLEMFRETLQPATLAEISDRLGWPRSSTYNTLYTLSERGYLYEPEHRGAFYPSPQWLSLATTVSEAQPLPAGVHGLLTDLVAETGETSLIAAQAGTNVIFLDVVESPALIKYAAKIGDRAPITASCSGRAILAQFSAKQLGQTLRQVKFEKLTETTLLSIEDVEMEIRRSVERGYHRNTGDRNAELFGVSLPLPSVGRRLSVTVAGPAYRIKDRFDEMASKLISAVKRSGVAD